MSRSIGLYGGFFNPLHAGHQHVIQKSLEHLQLKKLIVLPAFENPLKKIQTHSASMNILKVFALNYPLPKSRYLILSTVIASPVLTRVFKKFSLNVPWTTFI